MSHTRLLTDFNSLSELYSECSHVLTLSISIQTTWKRHCYLKMREEKSFPLLSTGRIKPIFHLCLPFQVFCEAGVLRRISRECCKSACCVDMVRVVSVGTSCVRNAVGGNSESCMVLKCGSGCVLRGFCT